MKKIVKTYKTVNVFFERLALVLIVLMTLITMYRVIMRFFFNTTPSWSEELTQILVVWVTLIGLAIGVRERIHLGITIFYDKFPKKVRKTIDYMIIVLQFLLGFLLITQGLALTIDQFGATMCVVTILPFVDRLMPNSVLYFFLPIAGLLIVVYSLIHLLDKNSLFTLHTLYTKKVD